MDTSTLSCSTTDGPSMHRRTCCVLQQAVLMQACSAILALHYLSSTSNGPATTSSSSSFLSRVLRNHPASSPTLRKKKTYVSRIIMTSTATPAQLPFASTQQASAFLCDASTYSLLTAVHLLRCPFAPHRFCDHAEGKLASLVTEVCKDSAWCASMVAQLSAWMVETWREDKDAQRLLCRAADTRSGVHVVGSSKMSSSEVKIGENRGRQTTSFVSSPVLQVFPELGIADAVPSSCGDARKIEIHCGCPHRWMREDLPSWLLACTLSESSAAWYRNTLLLRSFRKFRLTYGFRILNKLSAGAVVVETTSGVGEPEPHTVLRDEMSMYRQPSSVPGDLTSGVNDTFDSVDIFSSAASCIEEGAAAMATPLPSAQASVVSQACQSFQTQMTPEANGDKDAVSICENVPVQHSLPASGKDIIIDETPMPADASRFTANGTQTIGGLVQTPSHGWASNGGGIRQQQAAATSKEDNTEVLENHQLILGRQEQAKPPPPLLARAFYYWRNKRYYERIARKYMHALVRQHTIEACFRTWKSRFQVRVRRSKYLADKVLCAKMVEERKKAQAVSVLRVWRAAAMAHHFLLNTIARRALLSWRCTAILKQQCGGGHHHHQHVALDSRSRRTAALVFARWHSRYLDHKADAFYAQHTGFTVLAGMRKASQCVSLVRQMTARSTQLIVAQGFRVWKEKLSQVRQVRAFQEGCLQRSARERLQHWLSRTRARHAVSLQGLHCEQTRSIRQSHQCFLLWRKRHRLQAHLREFRLEKEQRDFRVLWEKWQSRTALRQKRAHDAAEWADRMHAHLFLRRCLRQWRHTWELRVCDKQEAHINTMEESAEGMWQLHTFARAFYRWKAKAFLVTKRHIDARKILPAAALWPTTSQALDAYGIVNNSPQGGVALLARPEEGPSTAKPEGRQQPAVKQSKPSRSGAKGASAVKRKASSAAHTPHIAAATPSTSEGVVFATVRLTEGAAAATPDGLRVHIPPQRARSSLTAEYTLLRQKREERQLSVSSMWTRPAAVVVVTYNNTTATRRGAAAAPHSMEDYEDNVSGVGSLLTAERRSGELFLHSTSEGLNISRDGTQPPNTFLP